MDESLYRQKQTVQRLFGPSATITGAMGSRLAPGRIEIRMDGRRLSCGRTFQQALTIASRRASALVTAGVDFNLGGAIEELQNAVDALDGTVRGADTECLVTDASSQIEAAEAIDWLACRVWSVVASRKASALAMSVVAGVA